MILAEYGHIRIFYWRSQVQFGDHPFARTRTKGRAGIFPSASVEKIIQCQTHPEILFDNRRMCPCRCDDKIVVVAVNLSLRFQIVQNLLLIGIGTELELQMSLIQHANVHYYLQSLFGQLFPRQDRPRTPRRKNMTTIRENVPTPAGGGKKESA